MMNFLKYFTISYRGYIKQALKDSGSFYFVAAVLERDPIFVLAERFHGDTIPKHLILVTAEKLKGSSNSLHKSLNLR